MKRTAAGLASCGETSRLVAANRQITPEQAFGAQGVLEGLRKVDGDTAKYALDNKLVDAASAEIEKSLSKQFGWSKEGIKITAPSACMITLRKSRMTAVTA